jgi:16S rRNA (cytosine967-C5)-methyltransferase
MREDETNLPSLQLDIIKKAANFVEAGGVLLYATCSLLREENEEVIERFEKSDVFKCKGFRPWVFSEDDEDRTPSLGGGSGDHSHSITLLPTTLNDGFFFARYRRQD